MKACLSYQQRFELYQNEIEDALRDGGFVAIADKNNINFKIKLNTSIYT